MLLLYHTSANCNNRIRALFFNFFSGTNITKNPILRMFAYSTGVKYYKISIVGFINNCIAHFKKQFFYLQSRHFLILTLYKRPEMSYNIVMTA